jgi:hypothetical protein
MKLHARASAIALSVLSPFFISESRRAIAVEDEPEAEAEEEGEEEESEAEEAPGAAKESESKSTTSVDAKNVSFERLLEANGPLIFGGRVKVKGDRFEVLFNAAGQMKAGFEGKGIYDSKSEEMKGANRKFIRLKDKKNKDEEEQLLPGLTAIGVGDGSFLSRFPVAGEPWVEMGFRIPNLIGKESNVRLRVNWKKKSGYETNFFKTIAYVSDGNVKGSQVTPLKEYQGTPDSWFPRKGQSVKVEFGIREGRLISRMDSKDVVLMKASDKGGHIGFAYSKLLFTIVNLKISGKLDRAWCEKEVERLRAEGKLKTTPDPAPDDLPPEASGEAAGG